MFSLISKIASQKKYILFILGILLIAILFETLQQLYYVKRFDLAENVKFFDLLKTQSYKWLVWVLLAPFISVFIKREVKKNPEKINFLKYALLVIGLVFVCVLVISCIQFIISDNTFSVSKLFNDYLTFFTFQKAPIFTLGYIAVAVIIHFYLTNQQLQIEVKTISELKETNLNLYTKLSKYNDDKTSVLNIKIGNNRKIIPVKDIIWIEADDYCVIVHTSKNLSYTMRSTLKALENKLANNFLRVHRKAIVNMDMVKELNLSNSPKLILQNNTSVTISKSNLKLVKDFIE